MFGSSVCTSSLIWHAHVLSTLKLSAQNSWLPSISCMVVDVSIEIQFMQSLLRLFSRMNVYTQTKVLMENICGIKLISSSDTKRKSLRSKNFKQQFHTFSPRTITNTFLEPFLCMHDSCGWSFLPEVNGVKGPAAQWLAADHSVPQHLLQQTGWLSTLQRLEMKPLQYNKHYTSCTNC